MLLFDIFPYANDYLEVQDHYSVYATGRDAIHVKVPIWAYGRVNNYYLSSNSYLYFSGGQYNQYQLQPLVSASVRVERVHERVL
jgi:hypothetical protein